MADVFNNIGSGGASDFLSLTDTPSSLSGQANKVVAVNGGETALEFVSASAGTLSGLSDTTITTPADNDVLSYDTGTGKWLNQTIAAAGLATSAQGALADSATQPGDNISTLTNDSAFITASSVTYETLNTNGDVGTGAGQLAIGDHNHDSSYQNISTATVQTTDATPTTLVDISIASDTEKLITLKVHGHEEATDDHIWKFMTIGAKNVGGTVSLVGGVDSATGYDAGASAWTIVASVSTSNVRITVTGEAAHTIDWRAHISID